LLSLFFVFDFLLDFERKETQYAWLNFFYDVWVREELDVRVELCEAL